MVKAQRKTAKAAPERRTPKPASGLPVEGGSVDQQLGAILEGSSDDEIVTILGEIPALDEGTKLVIGMQKLSPAVSAFTLLRPVADACTNQGIVHLFNKIGGISDEQVTSDIAGVYADNQDNATALMSHPPEMRRRLFFLSLAAGYLEADE